MLGVISTSCWTFRQSSNPGNTPSEEKFGKPKFGKTGIYGFSRVNNRAFVFESGFELRTKMSYYPTEIRSINRIDDTDWRERIL